VRPKPEVRLTSAVLLACALLSGCGLLGTGRAPTMRTVPGIPRDPRLSVRSFDAIVDQRQRLHLVWVECREGKAARGQLGPFSFVLRYQQSNDLGTSWSPPIALCVDEVQQPRLLECGGVLHVLIGPRGRDFVSRDGGATWSEQEPLVARTAVHERFLGHFDVATIDSSLIVAYAKTREVSEPPDSSQRDSIDFWIMTRRGNVTTEPRVIGSIDGGAVTQTSPRLWVTRQSLVVAFGLSLYREKVEIWEDGRPVTRSWEEGNVVLLHSVDAGGTWSRPSLLPTPSNGAQHWLSVDQVELFPSPDRVFLLFNSRGALHTAPIDGDTIGRTTWQRSLQLQLMDELNCRDLSCVGRGDEGTLAWIAPHRETSGTPLSDLLGPLPSDVFVASCVAAGHSFRVGAGHRLTFVTNQVMAVRVLNTSRGRLVLWSETQLGPLLLGWPKEGNAIRLAFVDAN